MQRGEDDATPDEEPDEEQGEGAEPATPPARRGRRRRCGVGRLVGEGGFMSAPTGRRRRRGRRERSLNLVDGTYCGPRMLLIALPIGTP
jgi:hypothetical protein